MKIHSAAFYYGASKCPVSEHNLKNFFPLTFDSQPATLEKIEKALFTLCGGHHLKVEHVKEHEGSTYIWGDGFEVVYKA